jgi:hypothetical protein
MVAGVNPPFMAKQLGTLSECFLKHRRGGISGSRNLAQPALLTNASAPSTPKDAADPITAPIELAAK